MSISFIEAIPRLKAMAAIAGVALFAGMQSAALAATATVLHTDVNIEGLGFEKTDAFVFGGAYSQDQTAKLNGNDVLLQRQAGVGGGAGAGISVPISNGENGITQSLDGSANTDVNLDVDNPTPANPVFAAIGNASGRLENGNVIRFSGWVRIDPNNPVTVAPQIEPVFKFELWKEALSTNADTNGGQAQPLYGDKVIDTDQHLGQGIWIDLDNNGAAIDAGAAAGGRLRTIKSSEWTLIETTYAVDDTQWLGIADDPYTVSSIEEIRSVMFWGDFGSTDFSPDGADGGNLLFDNLLVEVFKNQAAVTPNTNPNPSLSEGGPAGDFDHDGDVDGTDLTMWRGAYHSTAAGDADKDGDSDGADFLIWQRNATGPKVSAVPEPASLAMLLCGLSFAALARRRSA